MSDVTVSSLRVYPVKSASGIAVPRARVGDRGFVRDRRWMLVDADGEFITQRSHPKLALILVRLDGRRMRLERPDAEPLEVPATLAAGERIEVTVWGDRCEALACGEGADAWFSGYLGIECRLVFMPDTSRRPVDPEHGSSGDIVSFADGYPFLLIEQASLDDLNARLDQPVPMDRFRPNIVVAGTKPFAADGWKRLRIGQVTFRVAKPCARCVVTTVDQSTGQKGREPLQTLAGYRQRKNKVLFGQNLIQETRGEVRVGDRVEIVERM